MRLCFSTDHVRNSTITNEQGQVIYKVITPFRPFFMKGTSTIWKIIPNTPPLYSKKRTDELNIELESDGEDPEDPNDPGVPTMAEDIHVTQSDEEEEEEEIILDMQDRFEQLAQIEFHKFQTSRIRWFGLNRLGQGEVSTKEFIPSRGISRRSRTFTGPDDRVYRWHLGMRVCKLYRESDPDKPVAQYHRYSLGLLSGKRPRCGFLDINLPKPNQGHSDEHTDTDNYTDHELESTLEDIISPELLDTIIVTFIYVEKLRREREKAWKKDIRWNY
ncbi:hypothetical protein DEU56DRAFT_738825 [Suillus clintonianus]|uniref:uncharacterized protein n=1 Tax=Suillus clintonianus TaxID=1904413 RepID=UPI001B871197|nr:uncharacterized protein DEU56DRAFT_738825 [Suillus clintonianus]KAG2133769.1 hypothetical protein DEU56DRAFT_738825 [Suillus clintonianus]